MLKDMIYSKSMSSLLPTLLYILGFTLTLEAMRRRGGCFSASGRASA